MASEYKLKIQELEEDKQRLLETQHQTYTNAEEKSCCLENLNFEDYNKLKCLKCKKEKLMQELAETNITCSKETNKNVELQDHEKVLSKLRDELDKLKEQHNQSQFLVNELQSESADKSMKIKILEDTINENKLFPKKSSVDASYNTCVTTCDKSANTSCSCSVFEETKNSKKLKPLSVCFDDASLSDVSDTSINVLKAPPDDSFNVHESKDLMLASSTRIKTNSQLLEGAIYNLRESVSKIVLKEYDTSGAKERIEELEKQLEINNDRDDFADQADSLNIVENDLQAWKTKDGEVEHVRKCREMEVNNLKATIATLLNNLENEKIRGENLQKAVDLYLNSISILQEAEERYKNEITDQRVIIQNLQEALVSTKQSLEEYQNKFNQDVGVSWTSRWFGVSSDQNKTTSQKTSNNKQNIFSKAIEDMYDEHLGLEVELFNNTQDMEIYEMRVLKYQHLYKTLQRDFRALEEQKEQHSAFVDDLNIQLSDCQNELKNLFKILNEEQNLMEDESINLSNQISSLQKQTYHLSQRLSYGMQCLENEKEKNTMLEMHLSKKDCEIMFLKNELKIMDQKLNSAIIEIHNDKDKIIQLHGKLDTYNGSLTLLDEKSEMYQKSVEHCTQNLRKTEAKLANKIEQYNQLHLQYLAQINKCTSMEGEIETLRMHYMNEIHHLETTILTYKDKCEKLHENLQFTLAKLNMTSESESKIKADYIIKEKELLQRIRKGNIEHERLNNLVANLEQSLNIMNEEINQKNEDLLAAKKQVESGKKEHQADLCKLKNEINILRQKIDITTLENEQLKKIIASNNETINIQEEKKQEMIRELNNCLAEVHRIKADKDFLIQKNQELSHEVQNYQDLWESTTHSHSMSTVESVRSEGRNIVQTVRSWLLEQREMNNSLLDKLKQKNMIITKLQESNRIFQEKLANHLCAGCNSRIKNNARRLKRTSSKDFMYHPGATSPTGNDFSLESLNSPDSSNSELNWEEEGYEEQFPQVWLDRVESLTGELHKSNIYWKNKLNENENSLPKEK